MASQVHPCASVAIVGHSFVRRMGEFVADQHLYNLRIRSTNVEFFGVGGARIRPFIPICERWIARRRFDVIFIQLGSNDLCDPASNPEQVATHIISLANYLIFGDTARRVVVGNIHFRVIQPYPGHNAKVHSTNNLLRRKISHLSQVDYAHLRGFSHPLPDYYLSDGVHLSTAGNHRYFKGMRGAILRALRHLDAR